MLKIDADCVNAEQINKITWAAKLTKCEEPKSVLNRLRLTIWDELRFQQGLCLDWGFSQLIFGVCHRQGGNQITIYDAEENQIKSVGRGKCLIRYENTTNLGIGPCFTELSNSSEKYSIPKFNFGVFYNRNE